MIFTAFYSWTKWLSSVAFPDSEVLGIRITKEMLLNLSKIWLSVKRIIGKTVFTTFNFLNATDVARGTVYENN